MGEKDVKRQVVSFVQQHLQSMAKTFGFYYRKEKDPRHGNIWIIDPFAANIKHNNLSMNEK